jgi:hypothetical protein
MSSPSLGTDHKAYVFCWIVNDMSIASPTTLFRDRRVVCTSQFACEFSLFPDELPLHTGALDADVVAPTAKYESSDFQALSVLSRLSLFSPLA